MDYAKFETGTLGGVSNEYYFGAYCRKCHHDARLNLGKLRIYLGPDFPLIDIRGRLRCEQCGGRDEITVTFLTPAQRTGNLHSLFDQVPHD